MTASSQPPDTGLRLPDFSCIGGMRCGSTTLWTLLRQHPGLFLPEEKETHFFDERRDRYKLGPTWYAAQFAAATADQRCGEVTPSYLPHDYVPDRMFEMIPDVKLLAIFRDPVKRAWSHYGFRVRQGAEAAGPARAFREEAARLREPEGWLFAYTEWSRYIDGLKRFEARFGRDRIHVLFLEELLKRPDDVMRDVYRFLDVKPIDGLEVPHKNLSLTPRIRWLHTMTKRAMAVPAGTSIASRAKRKIQRTAASWNQTSKAPQMPAKVEAFVRASLEPSDREFQAWLGRPLPWSS